MSSSPAAVEEKKKPIKASDIIAEFELEGTIKPGELLDILEAIRTLKQDTGWGKIELFYKNGDLDDHTIYIKRKATKDEDAAV